MSIDTSRKPSKQPKGKPPIRVISGVGTTQSIEAELNLLYEAGYEPICTISGYAENKHDIGDTAKIILKLRGI